MFSSNKDEFLLCYNRAFLLEDIEAELIALTESGLYVEKHGDPSRLIGEGTEEWVAWHTPHTPFDTWFVGICHVETGHLISGNDIRCIWDGGDANHLSRLGRSLGRDRFAGTEGTRSSDSTCVRADLDDSVVLACGIWLRLRTHHTSISRIRYRIRPS
jgi:hypothetical protein